MDWSDHHARGNLFRDLHLGPELLVLPNPWDVGTARLFENLGFRALATTSAGLAFSLGRRDGDGGVTAEQTFRHIAEIIAATRVPVSADLENGYGDSPEAVRDTILRAGEVGLAGASIEDATLRDGEPLFERSLAIERVQAAVETARGLGRPFVFTARTEGFIRGRPDLDEVLFRLQAYQDAGADVLYAPGLPDANAIRLVTGALTKPFNYVVGVRAPCFTLAELTDLGVRRVTFGTSFVRNALSATLRAAREVLELATTSFAAGLPKVSDFNELIDPKGA